MPVKHAKELVVYQRAYDFAMRIFELTKQFPQEERYALTSQIRRSSRSVSMNLREAWAKRRYAAHFLSKLSDCDAELNETDTSLDFARDCQYISDEEHRTLSNLGLEIGKMLGAKIRDPSPFLLTES